MILFKIFSWLKVGGRSLSYWGRKVIENTGVYINMWEFGHTHFWFCLSLEALGVRLVENFYHVFPPHLLEKWEHLYGACVPWRNWRVKALEISFNSDFAGSQEEFSISRKQMHCSFFFSLNTVLIRLVCQVRSSFR